MRKLSFTLMVALAFIGQPALLAASGPVKEGQVDLNGAFQDGPLRLAGEWMFFPQVLLGPEQFLQLWRENAKGIRLTETSRSFRESEPKLFPTNQSYASYAVILKGLGVEDLAILEADVYTSAHILLFPLNDPKRLLIADVGKTSTRPDASEPAILMAEILPFRPSAAEDYVLIIQISNFHHDWGGLWIPPTIGPFQDVVRAMKSSDRMSYWILGLIFFLATYNISMYYRRPEDQTSLILSAFAVLMGFRIFVLANYGTQFFKDPVWDLEAHLKVVYITMLMAPVLFQSFLQKCFPLRMSERVIWVFFWVSVIPSIFVLLSPLSVYSKFLEPMRFLSLGVSMLGALTYWRACRARDEGAYVSMIGSAGVMVGIVLDILNSYGFRYFPSNCSGMGLGFFIVAQSQITAQRFATAFRQSEFLSRELQSEVQRQTRDIKSILTNIHQGIFTINRATHTVDVQHSDYMRVLTGQGAIEGQTIRSLFLDRSTLTEDQKSLTESSLQASLGEDVLGFEMNSSNLVRELEYTPAGELPKKIIELDWNPVLDADHTVDKILVSVRDVSELRTLEFQAKKQEMDLRMVLDLIRIPEDRFQRFMEKTQSYLKENRELIQKNGQGHPEILKRLFVNMHTIKGAARTFGLRSISAASHEVEQYYARIQTNIHDWQQSTLLEDLAKVDRAVDQYKELAVDRLGWSFEDKAVKLSRREIEHTIELLSKLESLPTIGKLESLEEAKRILLQHCYLELPGVIREASQGIDSMAKDLGKITPRIDLQSIPIILKDKGVDLLNGLLTHLFRNSLDHGIETPELRQKKGKDPCGTISITADRDDAFLVFQFRDDGNGLDLQKLASLGRKLNLLKPDGHPSDQTIADLVFCSGLSTKDEVSDISGRGVGLDAVRSYLEDKGGDIQLVMDPVVDREHVPFGFVMRIPLDYCFTGPIQEPIQGTTFMKREA